MQNWYEGVIRYEKVTEEGKVKKVNELYLVEHFLLQNAKRV